MWGVIHRGGEALVLQRNVFPALHSSNMSKGSAGDKITHNFSRVPSKRTMALSPSWPLVT